MPTNSLSPRGDDGTAKAEELGVNQEGSTARTESPASDQMRDTIDGSVRIVASWQNEYLQIIAVAEDGEIYAARMDPRQIVPARTSSWHRIATRINRPTGDAEHKDTRTVDVT